MTTYHEIEQRTPEWDALRAGKLTASLASKLVTPTGKLSTQYKPEIARIIAESRGLQEPTFVPPNYWMERGVEMEPQATAWFEVETGLVVTPIGFVSSDNNLIGASPDGMVCHPDDIAAPMIPLELKCPKPSTHIRWLLDGGVPKDHIAQCHFQMVLCESDYMWFSSYSPDIAPLIVKVKWSEYTDTMVKAIESYTKEYHRSVEMLEEL